MLSNNASMSEIVRARLQAFRMLRKAEDTKRLSLWSNQDYSAYVLVSIEAVIEDCSVCKELNKGSPNDTHHPGLYEMRIVRSRLSGLEAAPCDERGEHAHGR